MGKLGRAERILQMIKDIRDNDGILTSRVLSEKYSVNQQMVLKDLQLAGKYGFVKHDRLKRAYIYIGN